MADTPIDEERAYDALDGLRYAIGFNSEAQRDEAIRRLQEYVADIAKARREGAEAMREILYKPLQYCLGVLCESGNLNNYRNLSDAELGKLWSDVAKEAAEALSRSLSPDTD